MRRAVSAERNGKDGLLAFRNTRARLSTKKKAGVSPGKHNNKKVVDECRQ